MAANNCNTENLLKFLEIEIIRFKMLKFAKANKDATMQIKAKQHANF